MPVNPRRLTSNQEKDLKKSMEEIQNDKMSRFLKNMAVKITIHGRPPTLNSWLSGTHWRVKAKEKKEWEQIIFYEIKAQRIPRPLKTPFKIIATQFCARTRDVDNSILITKFLLDSLKTHDYIPNDTPNIVTEIRLLSKKCAMKEERTEFAIEDTGTADRVDVSTR
jgi:Holliday junction resolvase RusA-like endonuclease